MFDLTFEFIGLLEPDGTFVDANRPALRFAGVYKHEIVGKPAWETPWWTGNVAGQQALREGIQAAAAGRFVRFEAQHRSSRGEEICVDFSLKPIFDDDGRVALLVAEGRDITERKRIEQLREQWTGAVAHDLKQPQNALHLWLTVLERHMGELGQREQRAIVHMRIALHHLERMTNDLLDATRIEAGHLALHRQLVDFGEIVEQVVEDFTSEAPGEVSMELGAGTHVVDGDPLRLHQIVGNLLDNAHKYHCPGTMIRVLVGTTNESVELSMENESDSLLEEDLSQIFDRFHRSSGARHSQVPGTGLGLHIARCLVEAHGGCIEARAPSAGRVLFSVRLPSATSMEAKRAAQ